MATILVADDDVDFLGRIEWMLKRDDHTVITAGNPNDALRVLSNNKHIDVAIIDYRLRDGKRGDRTGLDVAAKSNPLIPKIIVSQLVEKDEVMEAVNANADGLALAVRFLAKDDISIENPKLAEAVRDALDKRASMTRRARESISPQLYGDYKTASLLANLQSILHLVANTIFVALMVVTAIYVHGGVLTILFTMVGVLAGEVTNLLLAKKTELLIARADRYHSELLQGSRFEQLLAACDSIDNKTERDKAKRELINGTSTKWIAHGEESQITSRPNLMH
jgi:CheY-like chemotaxis protein